MGREFLTIFKKKKRNKQKKFTSWKLLDGQSLLKPQTEVNLI
jgi:hypothetical protein